MFPHNKDVFRLKSDIVLPRRNLGMCLKCKELGAKSSKKIISY